MRTVTPEELIGSLNTVERKYAPDTLYIAGDPGIFHEGARVSIVGSRNASQFGLARARKLARRLAERGIVVVSGLAAGIDTAAHTAAMEAGGRTVAVIGTPLDRAYPKQNAMLQAEIARHHLVISQFAPGARTQPHHFPQRNRTMALLSDATVIIEAGEKSGSLHQAWEALRLNRDLFITRATAMQETLTWPAALIEYGARVLSDETFDSFLESLPPRQPLEQDAAFLF